MPVLCFAGDLHGNLTAAYGHLTGWMERTGVKIDALIQVGDLGVYRNGTSWSTMWHTRTPAPIPTWACMGNHEDPLMIRQWELSPSTIPDMHLLPDGEITDVLGVKIGCIWGNYSPISWLNPGRVHQARSVGGESERIAMHIDRDAVDHLLEDTGTMDVLVTHDSAASTLPVQFRGVGMDPVIKSILGLRQNEEVGGCQGFDRVLKEFKPEEYFFGHLHCFDEGMVGPTHYTCLNAIGYQGGPWYKVFEFNDDDINPLSGGINILGGGQ